MHAIEHSHVAREHEMRASRGSQSDLCSCRRRPQPGRSWSGPNESNHQAKLKPTRDQRGGDAAARAKPSSSIGHGARCPRLHQRPMRALSFRAFATTCKVEGGGACWSSVRLGWAACAGRFSHQCSPHECSPSPSCRRIRLERSAMPIEAAAHVAIRRA